METRSQWPSTPSTSEALLEGHLGPLEPADRSRQGTDSTQGTDTGVVPHATSGDREDALHHHHSRLSKGFEVWCE